MEKTTNVCGRLGCGDCLLCCRSDCPLITVDLELGLKRIYRRAAFTLAGLPASAPERPEHSDADTAQRVALGS